MKYVALLEILYKTVGYMAFVIGLCFLTKSHLDPWIKNQFRKYKRYARLRKLQVRESINDYHRRVLVYRHLQLLLGSVWPWFTEASVIHFIILTSLLFSLSTVVYIKILVSVPLSLLLGLITAAIPYFFLLLGLTWKRSDTSYELVPAVSTLLGKYRVNAKDLYSSIVDTIKEMDNYKSLQKSFFKLASTLQNQRNKEDLEKAIELFVFQIGTSWAKQLGVLLLSAQWEGKDIERSLSNIVKDMGKAQEIIEQQKSSNQDTIQMGFFVPIIIFPASLYFLSRVLTSGKFFYFQFQTRAGGTSFMVTLILCLVSFIVSLLLRKPKNEI